MKRILRTLILVLTAVSLMCSFSFSAYADDGGENPPPEVDIGDVDGDGDRDIFDIVDSVKTGYDFLTQWWNGDGDQAGENLYDFLHPEADSEQGQAIKDSYKPEVSSNWKDDDGDGKYDSFTVPENYNLYGKRTLKYPDGSYELFTVHFFYETPTREDVYGPVQPWGGNYIELTRQNSAGATVSKKLTIIRLDSIFHAGSYFGFRCYVKYPDSSTSYLRSFYFTGSTVNDISLDSKSVVSESNWFQSYYYKPGSSQHSQLMYVVSIGSTNNSSFYADVSNIYSVNLFGVCPIIISNVLGGTQIDMNNYMKFGDLGFSFNPDVGLSFDPDIYFDKYYKDFSVDIENLFKRIYSKMPEIGDTFVNSSSDTTYNYLDIFQPEEQPPATTPSGGGSDVNVNVDVDVTLPPEWLDSYPELDTTPAIDLDSPDYDYFKDNSLTGPPQATSTFLQMALDFIVDNGFLPYLCAIVLLVIFWRLTGGS